MFESVDKHERRWDLLRNRQVLLQINNISVPFSVLSVPTRTNRKLEMTQPCGMQQTWMLLIITVLFPRPITCQRPFYFLSASVGDTDIIQFASAVAQTHHSSQQKTLLLSGASGIRAEDGKYPSRRVRGRVRVCVGNFLKSNRQRPDLLTPTHGFLRPNGAAALYFLLIRSLPLWPRRSPTNATVTHPHRRSIGALGGRRLSHDISCDGSGKNLPR